MPEHLFPRVPDAEAIAALQRRGIDYRPSEHWTDLWQEAHQTAFTVARSAGFDILKDIHAALLRAMTDGHSFEQFRKDLMPILQRKGWWGRIEHADPLTGEVREVQLGSLRRLHTIFDTNLRVSAAQGDWERQQQVKEERPYLRYTALLDSRTRPLHRAWHGIILPTDHIWWKTHYPPNGWRCRCKTMSVGAEDIAANGWEIKTPPDDGTISWINPHTGDVLEVPRGIDPGWGYNPGMTDQAAQAAHTAMDKLVMLPPELGAAASTALQRITPQVEKELGEWIGSVVQRVTAGKYHGTKERRIIGCIDESILAWLKERVGVVPQTAAISINDDEILHLLRTSKQGRGNALPLEDIPKLPSYLHSPEAVYWDKGLLSGLGRKRAPGLIYIFDAVERHKGKLVVCVDLKRKGKNSKGKRETTVTNAVCSGRVDIRIEDLNEEAGYFKIK